MRSTRKPDACTATIKWTTSHNAMYQKARCNAPPQSTMKRTTTHSAMYHKTQITFSIDQSPYSPDRNVLSTKFAIIMSKHTYLLCYRISVFPLIAGVVKSYFWGGILLSTVVGLMYHITSISMLYFSYGISVAIEVQHKTELVFPAVTICNMSPIRASSLAASTPEDQAKKRKKRCKNLLFLHRHTLQHTQHRPNTRQ